MEEREAQIRAQYARLTAMLIEKKLTVTTMESATGGQIASLLTDTEGASAVLRGAVVTYCTEEKLAQGVPSEIINRYGVYSEETALAMAHAARKRCNADIGIGVTGTLGRVDPANAGSVSGEVYFALECRGKAKAVSYRLPPCDTRLAAKLAVAGAIAEVLTEQLNDF